MPDETQTTDAVTTEIQTTASAHKALAAAINTEFGLIKSDFETRFAALSVKIDALPAALHSDIEDGISRLRSAL